MARRSQIDEKPLATHGRTIHWVKMSRATHFVGTAGLPQTVCPSLKGRLTLDVTARVTRIGRAEPQNKEGESWTSIAGLSSESIRQSCAMRLRSRRMDVRYLGEIDTT